MARRSASIPTLLEQPETWGCHRRLVGLIKWMTGTGFASTFAYLFLSRAPWLAAAGVLFLGSSAVGAVALLYLQDRKLKRLAEEAVGPRRIIHVRIDLSSAALPRRAYSEPDTEEYDDEVDPDIALYSTVPVRR
ncbi:hypothetical protein [Planctomyces sp. SH-PL14]|uniref:hypothetical protein n=1 Tax=Planctomyces sp. SH-PL14 TaxID=1632864 RepID=UPI00078BF7EC|nr:hypothetical protein [Planctomyces sp. SH-PL14]AMV21674.1 hypothetical protein VT03_27475 [Planctomyces sp. SH-PL14]